MSLSKGAGLPVSSGMLGKKTPDGVQHCEDIKLLT